MAPRDMRCVTQETARRGVLAFTSGLPIVPSRPARWPAIALAAVARKG